MDHPPPPPPAVTLSTLFTFVFPFTFLTIFLLRFLLPASPSSAAAKTPPPSPPSLPVIGNLLHLLTPHPHRALSLLADHYGPIFLLHLPSHPLLLISSADDARDVILTHHLAFSSFPQLTAARRLLSASKRAYIPRLLNADIIRSYREIRQQEVGFLAEEVTRLGGVALALDLSEIFEGFITDVMCRVVLGRRFDKGFRVREMVREMMRLLGGFYMRDYVPWLGWVDWVNGKDAKIKRLAKEFGRFLDGVVEEHIEEGLKMGGGDGEDLVDVLLRIQGEEEGSEIDRDCIKGIILDMFAGGIDTTYTVLEWAMTEILRHPRVYKKLQSEAMDIANGRADITECDLDNMPYLKAVIKETLRLHPPLPLLPPRESTEDVRILDHDIEAKTMVLINVWAIGRDAAEWNEPEEFRPERFINSSVDFKGQDFQFLPFGAGSRACPGILFAMTTNELVLANIIHKFDWELPAGTTADDIDMTECSGLVARRKTPLVAVAKPRSF